MPALRYCVTGLVTVAAGGALVLGSVTEPDTDHQLAQMSLAAGDGSPALFTAAQLVPGHEVSNCLQITDGPGNGRPVRFAAAGLSGSLVSGLRMRVEVGTGGSLNNCAGFTGRTVFDGPLTTLARAGSTGIATGWTPASRETRTYRLTVEVADDNALQHVTGGATFTWLTTAVDPEDPPSPGMPPATAPSASPSPTPPATSATPYAPTQAPHTPPAPPASSRRSAIATAIDAATRLLVEAARRPWCPLLSIAVAWLFLLIADRSDRRDPKLALAPVVRHPYLVFPPDNKDDGDGSAEPNR
jgi:hypothetical protein